jgi:hypothetical protein
VSVAYFAERFLGDSAAIPIQIAGDRGPVFLVVVEG